MSDSTLSLSFGPGWISALCPQLLFVYLFSLHLLWSICGHACVYSSVLVWMLLCQLQGAVSCPVVHCSACRDCTVERFHANLASGTFSQEVSLDRLDSACSELLIRQTAEPQPFLQHLFLLWVCRPLVLFNFSAFFLQDTSSRSLQTTLMCLQMLWDKRLAYLVEIFLNLTGIVSKQVHICSPFLFTQDGCSSIGSAVVLHPWF